MSARIAIVIPARYGSTRFPGKPLTLICGKPMINHVIEIGQHAVNHYDNITLVVATEDERIAEHCASIDVHCVMTSDNCATGSDRVLEALENEGMDADLVIGLQGDAPGTPKDAIPQMIDIFKARQDFDVITPVVKLGWKELDALRTSKISTPFTGTTALIADNGKAFWFSKNILPAIRGEDKLRANTDTSPVYQHLGLYGFKHKALKKFVSLPQGHYEQLEGLEQLRLLENNMIIQTYTLDIPLGLAQAGIDSPEDVARFEALAR